MNSTLVYDIYIYCSRLEYLSGSGKEYRLDVRRIGGNSDPPDKDAVRCRAGAL
jgi:hypothetical protein